MLAIDIKMINIINPAFGHLKPRSHAVEISLVDYEFNTIYQSRCRPDDLPITGKISVDEFRKKFGMDSDEVRIDLRDWATGLRPGDLDDAPPASLILPEVRQIIQGKCLIGHRLKLEALDHFGPSFQAVRDIDHFMAWERVKHRVNPLYVF